MCRCCCWCSLVVGTAHKCSRYMRRKVHKQNIGRRAGRLRNGVVKIFIGEMMTGERSLPRRDRWRRSGRLSQEDGVVGGWRPVVVVVLVVD